MHIVNLSPVPIGSLASKRRIRRAVGVPVAVPVADNH
jgi:hypothetical protein